MNVGSRQIQITHDIANIITKLTLKSTFHIVPLQRQIVDLLPKVLHLSDPFAEWAFGCHIKPIKIEHMPAEWVYADHCESSNQVVLFLHGGGYVALDPITHRTITSYIAKKTGAKVLAISYRKAPEHKYPAQINDAIMAWDFLLAKGYRPENIAIMGDSAGGNLSITTTLKLIKENRQTPSCVCVLSPWGDMTASGDSIVKNKKSDSMIPAKRLYEVARHYAGFHALTDPLISPVFADFTGFPPFMIHVGSIEILLDDARRLAEAAAMANCEVILNVWDNGSHVFQVWNSLLPDARNSLRQCAEFISHHTDTRNVIQN